MEAQHNKRRYKTIIVALLLLILISAVLLAINLKNRYLNVTDLSTVIIPDNIIQAGSIDEMSSRTEDAPDNATQDNTDKSAFEDPDETLDAADVETIMSSNDSVAKTQFATGIILYKDKADANLPFRVSNMFPGDIETEYYSVQVSFRNTVTVKFFAEIRPGYEKLAEVFKTKIVLLNTGETMYDGLMSDMPESLDHDLVTDKESTEKVFYKIITYLDTSVDNQYQDKELVADFHWWVEDDTLADVPITGETVSMIFWLGLMSISLGMLILFYIKMKKKEGRYE